MSLTAFSWKSIQICPLALEILNFENTWKENHYYLIYTFPEPQTNKTLHASKRIWNHPCFSIYRSTYCWMEGYILNKGLEELSFDIVNNYIFINERYRKNHKGTVCSHVSLFFISIWLCMIPTLSSKQCITKKL